MPRRPNTHPTNIYWLIDVRPETISAGWSGGKPFYCGKTVATPHGRFNEHMCRAVQYPKRKISKILNACGRQHVRIEIMTIVPIGGDWVAAEKRWIAQLRLTNPDAANVGHGGEGPSGMVHTPEARAKMSRVQSNRSEEWRRRISVGRSGIGHTAEARAKMSESQRNSKATAENLRRMSKANIGRKHSPEARAKMSAALTGMKRSPESCRNIRAAQQKRRATSGHANSCPSPGVLE